MKKITVLIALYKAGKFLAAKTNDLRRQSMFDDCIFVFLNCQNHNNEDVICRKFLNQHVENAHIIEYRDYVKLYRSWNDGIKATKSKYIVNANVDDVWHPQYLERLCKELDDNPELSVVASKVYTTHKIGQLWPDWQIYGELTTQWPGGTLGPCPVWRRNLHEKYGYFDDCYVISDALMWYRWEEGGEKFKIIDEYLALYYQGGNLEKRIDPKTNLTLNQIDRIEHYGPDRLKEELIGKQTVRCVRDVPKIQ